MYLLGIDVGTSMTKAVLFDLYGREVWKESNPNETIQQNTNWSEQDMNQLWLDTCNTIKNLLDNSDVQPDQIKAIGITGQGEGAWLINQEGEPVGKAILWNDGRAVDTVAAIKNDPQLCQKINQITGSFPFTGATSMLLKWLKDNDSEYLKNSQYCVFCKDWIRFKMTGEIWIDYTDASTSLLDLKTNKISQELFELLGIEEYLKLIPLLNRSSEIAGYLLPEVAKKTGLLSKTPVVTGMLDIVATAVGNGTVNLYDSCTILGTTCSNLIIKDKVLRHADKQSGFECHSVDDLYINVIAAMAGTPNLDWVIENLFQKEKQAAEENGKNLYSILEERIRNRPPGSNGVIYHPYISPAGERAPFYDPHAKAQFFGLSTNVDKNDLLQAVYEGIALAIKDCLPSEKGALILGGGGSQSNLWPQIIADCTGREVVILHADEFAAKGAALAAGVAVGLYNNLKEASLNTRKVKRVYTPNETNFELYQQIYQIYREIRISNTKLWKMRSMLFQ